MKEMLLVALGGGTGSILRYLSGKLIPSNAVYSTLLVNIAGGFLVGLLFTLSFKNNWGTSKQLLFITGLCGGFTTFSAFSLQNLELIQQHRYLESAIYVAASVVLSIIAVYAGFIIAK